MCHGPCIYPNKRFLGFVRVGAKASGCTPSWMALG